MLPFLPLFSILSLYFDKVKGKFAFPIFLFIKFLFPRSCPFVQIAAGRQLFPTERGTRRPASSENLTGFYLFFRRFPIDKRRCIGYPVSSEIEYRHTMKGICLFCLHPRERLSGAKPYGSELAVSPRSVNYLSGRCWTPIRVVPRRIFVFVSLIEKEAGAFFILLRLSRKGSCFP